MLPSFSVLLLSNSDTARICSTPTVSMRASSVQRATVPGAPTGLSAVPHIGTADLSWTGSTSNGGATITGYNVYKGTSAGGENFSTPVNSSPVAGTTYTATGLTGGQTYFFEVKAVNSAGESTASNEASTAAGGASGTCTQTGSGSGPFTVTCGVGSGSWAPPAGVYRASVDVEGAGGGAGGVETGTSHPNFGGLGFKTTDTLAVATGTPYSVQTSYSG